MTVTDDLVAGKYRPGFNDANPKRWKANFRCALNSLPDVKEVPSLSRKNGSDGYTVYKLSPTTSKLISGRLNDSLEYP